MGLGVHLASEEPVVKDAMLACYKETGRGGALRLVFFF